MRTYFFKNREEDIRRNIESAKNALSCLYAQCAVKGFEVAEIMLELTKGRPVSIKKLIDQAATELTEKLMPGVNWGGLIRGNKSSEDLISTRQKITAPLYCFWSEVKGFEDTAKALLYQIGFPDIWSIKDNVLIVDPDRFEDFIKAECEYTFSKSDEAGLKLIEELSKAHRNDFYPEVFVPFDNSGADLEAYARWLKSSK